MEEIIFNEDDLIELLILYSGPGYVLPAGSKGTIIGISEESIIVEFDEKSHMKGIYCVYESPILTFRRDKIGKEFILHTAPIISPKPTSK